MQTQGIGPNLPPQRPDSGGPIKAWALLLGAPLIPIVVPLFSILGMLFHSVQNLLDKAKNKPDEKVMPPDMSKRITEAKPTETTDKTEEAAKAALGGKNG